MKKSVSVLAIICSLVLIGFGVAVAYYNYTLWNYGVAMYFVPALYVVAGIFGLYYHILYIADFSV